MSDIYRLYGTTAETILNMDYVEGIAMYIEAVNSQKDDRLFFRWVIGYQNSMSFDEFKNKLNPPQPEEPSVIHEKVKNILEATINGNI